MSLHSSKSVKANIKRCEDRIKMFNKEIERWTKRLEKEKNAKERQFCRYEISSYRDSIKWEKKELAMEKAPRACHQI